MRKERSLSATAAKVVTAARIPNPNTSNARVEKTLAIILKPMLKVLLEKR
jgi:hypothetical protein